MNSNFKLGLICFFTTAACSLLLSCYSFKGTSINPNVRTFDVKLFSLSAPDAPGNIHLDFTTRLREKIERESRLIYNAKAPDIIFEGTLKRFSLKSEAPTGQRTSAIDRLTIEFEVSFTNTDDEQQNWKKTFSHFADMNANDSFTERQDELINTIYDQITEDIFNAAFSNW